MWTAREAAMTGGAVFSSSRVGLTGLLKADGRVGNTRELLLLDEQREFTVPWVTDLDALQILQLRKEASSALPLLREKMCKALRFVNESVVQADRARDLVTELREQAAEVRVELQMKGKSAARFWKTTYAVLGLGLSVYGAAADQAVAGVAGLLPIIQLLISHKSGYESEVSKLTSKPGYVLVKAQDILAHAKG